MPTILRRDKARRRPGAAYFCAAVIIAVGILPFSGPGAEARTFSTGVSIFEYEGPTSGQAAREAARVKSAGADFVLHWLLWEKVAPKHLPDAWDAADPAAPEYDWTEIDQRVIESRAAGLEPLLQIYSAPNWANRCEPARGDFVLEIAPCDPLPSMLADFARAAAERYSGDFGGLPRVRFWQVQNEPNLLLFFAPQFNAKGHKVSPGIYRNILNKTYPAIKSVHADNVVLAAGLAPNRTPGGLSPLDFSRRLFCLDNRNRPIRPAGPCAGGVKLDAFDMHPYTSGGPDRKAEFAGNVQMGNLGQLKAVLRAADKAGRINGAANTTPLWITEMSWDSKPPDPGGVPMSILTRWTAEVIHRAWSAGISKFFWHGLRDQAKGGAPWSATIQSGLYFRGTAIEADKPKRSLSAFRFPMVAYSKRLGASFWGRTPTSQAGLVKIQFRSGGGWRVVATTRASGNGIFRGFVRSKALTLKRGQMRAVYLGRTSVPFGLKPVRDFYQRPFG